MTGSATPACDGGATSTPVGLVFPPSLAPDQAVAIAVAAEEAGLHSVCTSEAATVDAMALLGAVAHATEHIRLESAVVSALSRSPSLIAMGAHTLARLSNGRFALGLGAGSPAVAAWHGTTLERPLELVRRAVTDVRAALAGERLPDLGGFRLQWAEPVHVPIRVAALNPRMIDLAATLADGVLLTFASPAQVAPVAERVARSAVDAGVTTPRVIATTWLGIGRTAAEARDAVRRSVAPYFGVPTYARLAEASFPEEMLARIRQALSEGGPRVASRSIPDHVVDALAIVGSDSDVRARVAAFAAAGADEVHIIPVFDDDDPAPLFEAVQMLAAASAPPR